MSTGPSNDQPQRRPARSGARSGSPGKKPVRDALGPYRTGYPAAVERLIDELAGLPGVGRRSAERLALFLVKSEQSKAQALATAIAQVKATVRNCAVCYHLTEDRVCKVCADENRDRSLIMVVEQPRDLLALEAAGVFKGVYHVLLGRISPLDGVGPTDLTIPALLDRARSPQENFNGVRVREIVLGLNPTLEGDGTALFLADQLQRITSLRVSRLARGLPTGGQLELANKAVLTDAIEGRREV